MSMRHYHEPTAPLREVLRAMTGVEPPEFVGPGIYFSDDVDAQYQCALQDWAASNVKPYWLTGIGLLDAADAQICEAISNANIKGPPPTLLIDRADQDPATIPTDPERPLPAICPECGEATAEGYGLAGGGFGQYVACKACDFMSKVLESDEEES